MEESMSPRKLFTYFILTTLLAAAVACQQKNPKRTSIRSGRNSRGDVNSPLEPSGPKTTSGVNACGSYSVPGKVWGDVTSTAGDQAFMQEINYMMSGVFSQLPQEDQLGYVSSQANQSTGVRFWGNVQSANASGQGAIDVKTAEIRIEIFDDRACQTRSDGTQRPMIPIHISANQPGVKKIEGYITGTPNNGGSANLYFEDAYGAIILQGTFSGQYYTGTMSYTLAGYSGSRTLGRFTVKTCNFFVCY
jgi:hypothetical protein